MRKWQILLNLILETALLIGVSVLLIIFVPKFLGFFWPFVASWILALLATPLCNFLEKKIKLNKKWISVFIIVLVLAALVGLAYMLIVILGKELISLLSDAPEYYAEIRRAIVLFGNTIQNLVEPVSPDLGAQIQDSFNDILSQASSLINDFAPMGVEALGSMAANVTNGLIGTLMMFLSAYFFIADRDKIGDWFRKVIPEDVHETTVSIKNRLVSTMSGFLLAQFKIMGIIFLILLVGLVILQNPYALLLALLIAFLDLLPILGTGTVLIPWALITFLRGNIHQGVILVFLYLICLLARQLLQPKIIGDSIGLDTLPTLVLIYAGYKISGLKGMVLALLIGVIFLSLFKLGVFDKKLARIRELVDEYRRC